MACPPAPLPNSARTPCTEAQESLKNNCEPDPQPWCLCSHLRAEKPLEGAAQGRWLITAPGLQASELQRSSLTSSLSTHTPNSSPTWDLDSEQARWLVVP